MCNLNSETKFESKAYLYLKRMETVCWSGAAAF